MKNYFALVTVFCVLFVVSLSMQTVEAAPRRRPFRILYRFFEGYRTLEEINKYMHYMVRSKSNATVSLHRIGTTLEGRPIRCLRLQGNNLLGGYAADNETLPWAKASRNMQVTEKQTRGVLITAAVHGREWITTASILYAASRILQDYGNPNNQSITEALDHAALHFIPVVNPDGYAFTWHTKQKITHQRYRIGSHTGTKLPRPAPLSRLWRGNRRKLGHGVFGVDLNRNWGFPKTNWGAGVSKMKSVNFQGAHGFSEPEVRAVRFYANRRKDINSFLDVHCCSQNVKAPFALDPYDAATGDRIAVTGKAIAAAMARTNGRKGWWYARRPEKRKKFSSGISSGWAYTEMGWEDSFTIELGAKGGKFIMPAKWIIIQAEEMLAATKIALVRSATTHINKNIHAIVPFSQGPNTRLWQQFLQEHKYFPANLKFSLSFGPATIKATKLWQRKNGIEETGFLDKDSLAKAVSQGFVYEVPAHSKGARVSYVKDLMVQEQQEESAKGQDGDDIPSYYGDDEDDEEEDKEKYEIAANENSVVEQDMDEEERKAFDDFAAKDEAELQTLNEFETNQIANLDLEDQEELAAQGFKAVRQVRKRTQINVNTNTTKKRALESIGNVFLLAAAILTFVASERNPQIRFVGFKLRTVGVIMVLILFALQTLYTFEVYNE